jgi:phytoene/squalene synthetase
MTIDEQIEALQNEFAVLWEKAMELNNYKERQALEALRAVVKEAEEMVDTIEEDRWTAQFDANWDRIAENH